MIALAPFAGARIPHLLVEPEIVSQIALNTAFGSSWILTPPTGIEAGDLLLVLFSAYAGNALPDTSSTGWVRLATQVNGSGAGMRSSLFAKIATGSDGITVAVTPSSNTWASYSFFRIAGARSVADVISTSSINTSSTPTLVFPTLTPPGGVDQRLWLAAFAWVSSTTGIVASAFPSGYGSTQQSSAPAGTNRTTSASGVLAARSGSQTPGNVTLSGNSTEYQTWTIAISRP